MSNHVEIFEVGPRDGLQNEAQQISLAEKIALVECLSGGGFKRIEVASFVSPKWVPQMAQSGDVLAGIQRAAGVSYAALTPNLRGFKDALGAKADEVAIFTSASEFKIEEVFLGVIIISLIFLATDRYFLMPLEKWTVHRWGLVWKPH